MQDQFLSELDNVEKIATFSKWKRFANSPFKYFIALGYRTIIYPFTKKQLVVNANLFFGVKTKIALPSSTDIYLTGGKSHSSEIRLAKYLIINLKLGNSFLDVGAHIGYFSLLASKLVGDKGKVYAFEPSSTTFKLLDSNTINKKNITAINKAISYTNAQIEFYEFNNLQSEYNTINAKQFENEIWYKKNLPQKISIQATSIDFICAEHNFLPHYIKIDVEGAEYDVLLGAKNTVGQNSPIIIFEYLAPYRNNVNHKKALSLLIENNYNSFIIENNGKLTPIKNIDEYLLENKIESENVVMIKNEPIS